jgi:hypothetical protein
MQMALLCSAPKRQAPTPDLGDASVVGSQQVMITAPSEQKGQSQCIVIESM